MVESTTHDSAGDEDNAVLESAKVQYSGDKVFYMTRRMSGMPLLHRTDKGYVMFDQLQYEKFNELLDKFPDPPTTTMQASVSASHSQSAHNKSSGGWGSIRGIAEKFNVFNKAV